MMRFFKYLLLLVLMLPTMAFAAINTDDIQLNLFPNNASVNTEYFGNPEGRGNSTEYETYFDGTGDYAKTTGTISFSNEGTISFWVNDFLTGTKWFVANDETATSTRFAVFTSSNQLCVQRSSNYCSGYTLLNTGTPQHIAVAFTSSQIRFYVDGVNVANTSHSSFNRADQWHFAANYYAPSNAEKMSLSNVLMFNDDLTHSEIVSLNAEGAHSDINTTDSRLVYYNKFDGAVDLSNNNNNAVIYGARQTNDNSWIFDGTDDYLQTDVPLNTLNSITFSTWVWIDSASAATRYIFSAKKDASDDIRIAHTSGDQILVSYDDGTQQDLFFDAPTKNTWYHLASVHDGTTAYLYINGNLVDSDIGTYNFSTLTNENRIGARSISTPTNYWDGRISNFMIFNKDLSATDVSTLYDNGRYYDPFAPEIVSNFTVTAIDNQTSNQINNFSVNITNDAYYTTTDGTVTTNLLDNSTTLYNITVCATGYLCTEYVNYNISTPLDAKLDVAEYPYEVINTVAQTVPVEVSSTSYVSVLTGSAPSTEAIPLYITATFNVNKISGGAAADIGCYIDLNGNQISREVRINNSDFDYYRSIYVMSNVTNTVTTGTSTASLLCRRYGSTTTFEVSNAILVGFRQIDSNRYNFNNTNLDLSFDINSPSSFVQINSVNFPVPDWDVSGTNKSIYALYDSEFVVQSDNANTIQGYLTIDELQCPIMSRYNFASPSSGSGNFICAKDVTGQDVTNITSYGKGEFSVNTQINVKYLAFEDYEFKQTFVEDYLVDDSNWIDVNIEQVYIDTDVKDLYSIASISAQSNTGVLETAFRFKLENANGTLIYRDFDTASRPGLIVNQYRFGNLSVGWYNVTFQAQSTGINPSDNGNIVNATLWSYAAGQSDATLDSFRITATDSIFSTSVQEFTANDGLSISTTDGDIYYPEQVGLINLTFSADNYYNATVLNHNTTNDLVFNAIPYAWINITAVSKLDASAITNFSIECNGYATTTSDGSFNLYQMQEPINGSDVACSFSHPNYATTSFNVTNVTPSVLNTYQVEAYTINSVNFTFYNLETNGLASDDTLIITLYSLGDDGLNYRFNTTNGLAYYDLISPNDYRGTVESSTYATREFSLTVTNRTHQNKDVYLFKQNATTEVTYTVINNIGTLLEDARVLLLRFNEDTNQWQGVYECFTTSSGQCKIDLISNRYYRYYVYYNDPVTPDLITEFEFVDYTSRSPFVIPEEVNAFDEYAEYDKLTIINFDYTNVTSTYLFQLEASFGDDIDQVCLQVDKITRSGLSSTVCNECMSQTGDVECNLVLENLTYVAKAVSYVDGKPFPIERLTVVLNDTKELFKDAGLVFVLLFVIVGIFFGLPDPVNTFIGASAGLFIGIITGFFPLDFSAFLTTIILGVLVIWRKRGAGSA